MKKTTTKSQNKFKKEGHGEPEGAKGNQKGATASQKGAKASQKGAKGRATCCFMKTILIFALSQNNLVILGSNEHGSQRLNNKANNRATDKLKKEAGED